MWNHDREPSSDIKNRGNERAREISQGAFPPLFLGAQERIFGFVKVSPSLSLSFSTLASLLSPSARGAGGGRRAHIDTHHSEGAEEGLGRGREKETKEGERKVETFFFLSVSSALPSLAVSFFSSVGRRKNERAAKKKADFRSDVKALLFSFLSFSRRAARDGSGPYFLLALRMPQRERERKRERKERERRERKRSLASIAAPRPTSPLFFSTRPPPLCGRLSHLHSLFSFSPSLLSTLSPGDELRPHPV